MKNFFFFSFVSLFCCMMHCSESVKSDSIVLSDLSILDSCQAYVVGKNSFLEKFSKKGGDLCGSLGKLNSTLRTIVEKKDEPYFFCPIILSKMIQKLNGRVIKEDIDISSLREAKKIFSDHLSEKIKRNQKILFSHEKSSLNALPKLLNSLHVAFRLSENDFNYENKELLQKFLSVDQETLIEMKKNFSEQNWHNECEIRKYFSDLGAIFTNSLKLYDIWKKKNEKAEKCSMKNILSEMFCLCNVCQTCCMNHFEKVLKSKQAREDVYELASEFEKKLEKKIILKGLSETLNEKKDLSYIM